MKNDLGPEKSQESESEPYPETCSQNMKKEEKKKEKKRIARYRDGIREMRVLGLIVPTRKTWRRIRHIFLLFNRKNS